jgi:hypothetical protein
MKTVVNLTHKHISEFTSADTIYIKHGNMGTTFLCQFVSFERGMVEATVIPREKWESAETLRVKLEKCALYGAEYPKEDNRYHWFRPDGRTILHDPSVPKAKSMDEEPEEHPGYVNLTLSHTNCTPPVTLFGSPIPHSHFVTLTIQKAKLLRSLHEDRIYAYETLARIAISKTQLADLFIQMNSSGTPGTLIEWEKKKVPEITAIGRLRKLKREFQESIKEKTDACHQTQASLSAIIENSKMGKKEKEFLLKEIGLLVMQIESNLPFIADQLAETMDDIVTAAKAEISTHMETTAQRLGIEPPTGGIPLNLESHLVGEDTPGELP